MFSLLRFSFYIGLRYSLQPKRNRFISIVSIVSFLGMVLGVTTLITVLSVMNGFSHELTDRILALTPHGRIYSDDWNGNWRLLKAELENRPGIIRVEPFAERKVIFSSSGIKSPAILTGVSIAGGNSAYGEIPFFENNIFESLSGERFKVALGSSLARRLGVSIGDSIEVTMPFISVTPLGLFPKSKSLIVTDLFEVGAQPDVYQAFVSLNTAQALFSLGASIDGLQLNTTNYYRAPVLMQQIAETLPPKLRMVPWNESQGSLFSAIKMEKILVTLMLLSVIFVAAFNVVSTLAIAVSEKKSDIAIFKTMGLESKGIATIFVVYGMCLSSLGVLVGMISGIFVSKEISNIVNYFESLFGSKIFDPSIYFITELPSKLLVFDIVFVSVAALGLSFVATIYPALKAAKILPTEILRYE